MTNLIARTKGLTRVFTSVLICFLASGLFGQPATRESSFELASPGDHSRSLVVNNLKRHYLFHVPKSYDPAKPQPVVLALHGAAMNGLMMVSFCGLNSTADEKNFVVVYPSGTGVSPFFTWNSGGAIGKLSDGKTDDVMFIDKLLDDLATVINVDPKRVYACGMSNGAMMCYRLAAELSGRIAAVAPVAGAITVEQSHPTRPVPVIAFHGTRDPLVPFHMTNANQSAKVRMLSVQDSISTWVKLDGCLPEPTIDILSKDNEMKVTRATYAGGKDDAEVVLITIEDGGHTWPGRVPPAQFMGKSDLALSANDLIWDFFAKHPFPK